MRLIKFAYEVERKAIKVMATLLHTSHNEYENRKLMTLNCSQQRIVFVLCKDDQIDVN